MTTTIRPARLEDAEQAQVIMNDSKNLVWLGGFTMLDDLKGRFGKQEETGVVNAVVVDVDGEIRATSQISPHDFHIEMGLVAVKRGFRDFEPTTPGELRHGYGRSMYTLHAFRAMLEGRLFLLDQINWQNKVMQNYLPALGFTGPAVTLRNKIRNFCTLEYWRFELLQDVSPWVTGIRDDFQYVIDPPTVYTEKYDSIRNKLIEIDRETDALAIERNRHLALKFVDSVERVLQ